MSNIRIRFCAALVKELQEQQAKAFAAGDVRLVRRIGGLLLFAKTGSFRNTAEAIVVSTQTIRNWVADLMLKGLGSLVYQHSSGRKPRLNGAQKKILRDMIESGPLACGFPIGCWSSSLIQYLIYQMFGILYNRHYVCALLRAMGFTWQKARFVSDHLDEKARQEWMVFTWPAVLADAKRCGALLLFEDEASFPQWGTLSYTWAPKGKQPCVPTSGRRKAYKVFGAIDFFTGRLFYQATTERFTSVTYIAFLKQILAKTEQDVVLIHDGAKYHTSRQTREFLLANSGRLAVYQLPSYSPDYNPIEYLWKKVKANSTHNRYFSVFESLVETVDAALRLLASQHQQVLRLMGGYDKILAGVSAA